MNVRERNEASVLTLRPGHVSPVGRFRENRLPILSATMLPVPAQLPALLSPTLIPHVALAPPRASSHLFFALSAILGRVFAR